MRILPTIKILQKPSDLLKMSIAVLFSLLEIPAVSTNETNEIYLEDKEHHAYLITTTYDTHYIRDLLQKNICGTSSYKMSDIPINIPQHEIVSLCQSTQDVYSMIFKSLDANEMKNEFTQCMTRVLKKICDDMENNAGMYRFTYIFTTVVLLFTLAFYLYQRHNYLPDKKSNPLIFIRTPDKTGSSAKMEELRSQIDTLTKECKEDNDTCSQLENISRDLNILEEKYKCVFYLTLINDPIVMSTGLTYDKSAVREWLLKGNTSCPQTKIIFKETADLLPNTSETAYQEIQSALATLEGTLSSIKGKKTLGYR